MARVTLVGRFAVDRPVGLGGFAAKEVHLARLPRSGCFRHVVVAKVGCVVVVVVVSTVVAVAVARVVAETVAAQASHSSGMLLGALLGTSA